MYLAVMDAEATVQHVVEDYISCLWVERFAGAGEFTLVVPGTRKNLEVFTLDTVKDQYLFTKNTNKIMFIETVELQTKYNRSSTITVKGRSAESMLDRRVCHPWPIFGNSIVYENHMIRGVIKDVVKDLINKSFSVDDFSNDRHVREFRWYHPNELPAAILGNRDPKKMDIGDTLLTSNQKIQTAGQGKGIYEEWHYDPYILEGSLYKIIQEILKSTYSGFAIEFMGDDAYTWYGYEYNGIRRTVDQTDVAPVIFSPKMDNLLEMSYYQSLVDVRTVIWTGLQKFQVPEDRGAEFPSTGGECYTAGNSQSLKRRGISMREGFMKDAGASETNGYFWHQGSQGGNAGMDPYSVQRQCNAKAEVELWTHMPVQMFTGTADSHSQYKYREDYYLGDIVTVENEFGMKSEARMVEYIRSSDTNDGDREYPTFETLPEFVKEKKGLNL